MRDGALAMETVRDGRARRRRASHGRRGRNARARRARAGCFRRRGAAPPRHATSLRSRRARSLRRALTLALGGRGEPAARRSASDLDRLDAVQGGRALLRRGRRRRASPSQRHRSASTFAAAAPADRRRRGRARDRRGAARCAARRPTIRPPRPMPRAPEPRARRVAQGARAVEALAVHGRRIGALALVARAAVSCCRAGRSASSRSRSSTAPRPRASRPGCQSACAPGSTRGRPTTTSRSSASTQWPPMVRVLDTVTRALPDDLRNHAARGTHAAEGQGARPRARDARRIGQRQPPDPVRSGIGHAGRAALSPTTKDPADPGESVRLGAQLKPLRSPRVPLVEPPAPVPAPSVRVTPSVPPATPRRPRRLRPAEETEKP